MADKAESSDEEPTIAEDVVVTKYKMAGEMTNRKNSEGSRASVTRGVGCVMA
mgnify:CR=1 FL=1